MEWKVFLTGDESDLNALSKSCCRPGLAVVREEEGFVLKSARFSELDDADAIRQEAEGIVVLLNGAARLELGARQDIALTSIARIADDGSRSCFVYLRDSLTLTARLLPPGIRLTHADGVEEEFSPADPALGWVEAGLGDAAVAKVLRLLGTQPFDWVNLYRILEVIEDDMGGSQAIAERSWASRRKLERFKHTANSPSVIGDDARHGEQATQPPRNPMSLSNARSLIETILHNWLREKQGP